jgi:hypothetical protein
MSIGKKIAVVIAIGIILILIYRMSRKTRPAAVQTTVYETRLGPPDIYPDSARTPGAANPDITQDNIEETICNHSWSTKSVRPPESYTHALKLRQISEYGYNDTNLRDYEEDHLIPLEIGGHPTDPRNLWPEPYQTSIADGGARFKDKVENYLHDQICTNRMPLVDAQQAIAKDWYRVYVTSIKH